MSPKQIRLLSAYSVSFLCYMLFLYYLEQTIIENISYIGLDLF